MKTINAFFIIPFLALVISCKSTKQELLKPIPVEVEFMKETLFRSGEKGDNWCITWGADGNQYTSMCDGMGWDTLHGFHRLRGSRKTSVRHILMDIHWL